MNKDEMLLAVRSCVDQVTRKAQMAGGPGAHIRAVCEAKDTEFGPYVAAGFRGEGADACRDECVRLVQAMDGYMIDDTWEDAAGYWLGVVDRELVAEGEERRMDDELPPPEEDELAEQLDMLEGPIAVTIPEYPECVPNAATKVVVVGLKLAGKGWSGEPYWNGDFPDLERARYWALKREREYKAKGYRASASVYWQHDIAQEQVVQRVLEVMNTGK